MKVTLAGMAMLVKLVHLKNAYSPMAVTLSGTEEELVVRAGRFVRDRLEQLLGKQAAHILGPTPLAVVKVNNRYRYRVHISCSLGASVRSSLAQTVIECSTDKRFRGVSVFAENDPMNS